MRIAGVAGPLIRTAAVLPGAMPKPPVGKALHWTIT